MRPRRRSFKKLAPFEPSKRPKLSIEELALKKTTLPYLDQIEYINAQLVQRGIKPSSLSPVVLSSTSNSTISDKRTETPKKKRKRNLEKISNNNTKSSFHSQMSKTYPRFMQGNNQTKGKPRKRPVTWLLRIVEEIFDYYYGLQTESPTIVISPFPFVARSYIEHTLGLPSIVDQECIDLLYNLEQLTELQVFSDFLKEEVDQDALLFFLHARHLMQSTFNISFRKKLKTTKRSSNLVSTSPHPVVTDGTSIVLLSSKAIQIMCSKLLRTEKLATFAYQSFFHEQQQHNNNLVSSQDVLEKMLNLFVNTPSDIVNKIKYSDNGTLLKATSKLQESLDTDTTLLENLTQKEQAEANALKLLNIKLNQLTNNRSNSSSSSNRSDIIVLQNSIRASTSDLSSTRKSLHNVQERIDSLWADVLQSNNDTASTTKRSESSVLYPIRKTFHQCITSLYKKHRIKTKAAALLNIDKSKEDLENKVVVKIQRAYRARLQYKLQQDRIRNQEAKERERLRNARQARILEKKRLKVVQDAHVQRHKDRMAALSKKNDTTLSPSNNNLIAKHNVAEANRRYNLRIRGYVQKCFAKWKVKTGDGRKKRVAKKFYFKVIFRKWKKCIVAKRHRVNSAIEIQRVYRGYSSRRKTRGLKKSWERTKKKMHAFVIQLHLRGVYKCFESLKSFSSKSRIVKSRFKSVIYRKRFSQWKESTYNIKREKHESASLIQSSFKSYNIRKQAALYKAKTRAATIVQRNLRGYNSRKITNIMKKVRNTQLSGVQSLASKLLNRSIDYTFKIWSDKVRRRRRVVEMTSRKESRVLKWKFHQWQSHLKEIQALQVLENERRERAAFTIQRVLKSFMNRMHFKSVLRRHKASIVIQNQYRKYALRQYFIHYHKTIEYAIKMQALVRGNIARGVAHYLRVDKMLLDVEAGNTLKVQAYFESGFAFNLSNTGESVCHRASISGSKRMIKYCLRNQMDVSLQDMNGDTPLHYIVSSTYDHRANLAEYLIDHGAWHEASNLRGMTPLLLACESGHDDVVRMLLRRQASIDATNVDGYNALQLATTFNHVNVVKTFLETFSPTLLEQQYSTDPEDGSSLLHACAAYGYLELLNLFGSYNFDWQSNGNTDCNGNTLAHYAVMNHQLSVLKVLTQEGGVVPDACNTADGQTPLHVALVEKCEDEIIKCLLEADVDVNVQDTITGATPLVLAITNHYSNIKLLLSYGADFDTIRDVPDGNLPLHVAAKSNNVDAINVLLDYGANVNAKNYAGVSPLGLARMSGNTSVVKTIQSRCLVEEEGLMTKKDTKVLTTSDAVEYFKTAVRISCVAGWEDYIQPQTNRVVYYSESNNRVSTESVPVEFAAALDNGTWIQAIDSDKPYYVNTITKEMRETLPAINPQTLQAILSKGNKTQLLRMKKTSNTSSNDDDYKSLWQDFDKEAKRAKLEEKSANVIQRNYKRYKAQCILATLKEQHEAITLLQRIYRGRMAKRVVREERHRITCAIQIQALWRGYRTRINEIKLRPERLAMVFYRDRAITITRVFRGWIGRRSASQLKAQVFGPRSYFEWEAFKSNSVVKRTFNVWEERVNSRSIIFYQHLITGQCTFAKPSEWVTKDFEDFENRTMLAKCGYTVEMKNSATLLQSLYRSKLARRHFQFILKSIRIMNASEKAYLENPRDITAQCNYMVLLHVIHHRYDVAREIYADAMEAMMARGPDIAFILLNYAIFLVVTSSDDLESVLYLVSRAKVVDPSLSSFNLAHFGFYRQSVILNPLDSESNFNYAVCQQLVYEDYDLATEHYLKAIDANPHKKSIMNSFNDMLEYINSNVDGYDLYVEWQKKVAHEADIEREKIASAVAENLLREKSAIKLQNAYRTRQSRKAFRRLLALSQAATLKFQQDPKSKADFLIISKAFEKLSDSSNDLIPISQLSSLLSTLGIYEILASEFTPEELLQRVTSDINSRHYISSQEFNAWWMRGQDASQWETSEDGDDGNEFYYHFPTASVHYEKPRFRHFLTDYENSNNRRSDTVLSSTVVFDAIDIKKEGEVCISELASRMKSLSMNNDIIIPKEKLGALTIALDSNTDNDCVLNVEEFEEFYNTEALPDNPDDWEEYQDEDGMTFFYNKKDNRSLWEAPKLLRKKRINSNNSWEAIQDEENGTYYYYNSATGESTWEVPPLPEGWEQVVDDSSSTVYYVNTNTNETQWEFPQH